MFLIIKKAFLLKRKLYQILKQNYFLAVGLFEEILDMIVMNNFFFENVCAAAGGFNHLNTLGKILTLAAL